VSDPLVWARALHFAASLSVTGGVTFLLFIGAPALRCAGEKTRVRSVLQSQLAWLAWISLAGVVITGFAWLVLLGQNMSELPLKETFSQGTVSTLLTGTDFGLIWSIRLVLAVVLAATLYLLNASSRGRPHIIVSALALLLAVGLTGTLAQAGHAAATEGLAGIVHLGSDFLHLVAAASWGGALIPLALLIRATLANPGDDSIARAQTATRRFLTVGMLSVGTLLATGIVNGAILVGSVSALFGTGYGRLLLLKIAVFFVMLGVATINRFRLTPRIMHSSAVGHKQALLQLRTNCLIEVAVGAIVLLIVGVLGTLPPGANE
jgi:putative copper resistance protein D